MEIAEYAQMERQEQNYWWHVGRREVLQKVLLSFVKPNGNLDILDVGCGTGINYLWLKRWGRVTGLDNAQTALDYCGQKGVYNELVLSDAAKLAQNKYDLITAFDILEHVENDATMLAQWYAGLKSGGHLFMTVPAYQWLFSAHDRALHHHRRYSAFELKKKLKAAGFSVRFISPFFFFTFPAVALMRLINKHRPAKTSYVETSASLSTILINLSQTEASILSQRIGLPWGSSLVAVATKK